MDSTKLTTAEILALPYFIDKRGYAILRLKGHPCSTGTHGLMRRARMVAYNAGLLSNLSKIVHHKDHDTLNDVPENFEIMGWGEHSSMHLMGNKVWLGRTHGPEARAKLSAKLKGRVITPEWQAKRVAKIKGRPLSEAHKMALSAALTGRKCPGAGKPGVKKRCGVCKEEGHNMRTHAARAA